MIFLAILWLIVSSSPILVLAVIFIKPVRSLLHAGGRYQRPDDSTASAYRFLTYVVMLSASVIFALIAQIPSKMFGFEVVMLTFSLIVLWETRVDLLNGSTVPLAGSIGHFMEEKWTRVEQPGRYWAAILINLGFGLLLFSLSVVILYQLIRDFT